MKITFDQKDKNQFFEALRLNINTYLSENNLTRFANSYVFFKTAFFLALYVGSFVFIYTANLHNAGAYLILSAFVIAGWTKICLVLNAAHDAVHNAFSANKFINGFCARFFDFVGSSSYLWGLRHVHSHHTYTNIDGFDTDIMQTGVMQIVPAEQKKKLFKYQHLYLPFLYLLFTMSNMFKRDVTDISSSKIGGKENIVHPVGEVIGFIFFKLFYLFYALIAPIVIIGISWKIVVPGFILMHFAASIATVFALFSAHIHEESVFPEPDETGKINCSWAEHQMKVTQDYATTNPLMGFMFGRVNYHVPHHLFPNYNQAHFPAMKRIIKKTADEFGIAYLEMETISGALSSHFAYLKRNGMPVVRQMMNE